MGLPGVGDQVMSPSDGKKPQDTSPGGQQHLHFLSLPQALSFYPVEMGKFNLLVLVSMVMPTGVDLTAPSESKFCWKISSRNVMSEATVSTHHRCPFCR